MAQRNTLTTAPLYAVEENIQTLGRNLRTARIRRNMTMSDAAKRIGTGIRAVRDAENGKVTTSIVVYYALLWLYNLLPAAGALADPDSDTEGKRLAMQREPKRAYPLGNLDNDF